MNIPRLLFRLALGRRLPTVSGTLTVPGLVGPVVVRRDGYGIPHVEAEAEEDAWYGLGFCQGQDRAFQLETLLRIARGTMAELVGPGQLAVDRLSRHIGFYVSAQRQLEVLDPEIRGMVEAFARGVGEGATLGCRRRAHEFTLLRTRPTRWTPTDVIAVSKLQSFALSSNWDVELARLRILRDDGPEALLALDPSYPEWLPVTDPPGAPAGLAIHRLAEDVQALREVVGHIGGSNGWALAPSRTKTGRPILANDPHLRPGLPAHWYLAHLRTPAWAVAGATFVGAPAFPAGHNGFAAWGITAGLADNTDLFIEEVGPDGASVRQGDRFVPCHVREETIRVKGAPDVVERVIETPRGPIVGSALGQQSDVISLRATWLDPRPVRGLLRAHRARSLEEFRRAFDQWPLMSLNVLYADTTGAIAWQLVGDVPRRRGGWGTLPRPGWLAESGWHDAPVPFDRMPWLADPVSGVVASANNRPDRDVDSPFLGVDWIDGYRAARIFEQLEARCDWDPAEASALQMDQVSIPWRELRDLVLATACEGEAAREAQAMLGKWDGDVSPDSAAASVFELFVAELFARTVEVKAPRSSAWLMGKGFSTVLPYTLLIARRTGLLSRVLRESPEWWFGDRWPGVVEEAFEVAVAALRTKYGRDHSLWAWGRIRSLTLRHPAGRGRFLGRVFNLGPFPWGGDENTVAQAATNPFDPTANPLATASLRMAVDVGNWGDSRFSLPGGQSGNPASPHYDDLLPLWRRGDGVPIAWSPADVGKAERSSLRLVPGRGGTAGRETA